MKQGYYEETGKKIYLPAFWDVQIGFPKFWRNIVAFPSGWSSPKRKAMLEDTTFVYTYFLSFRAANFLAQLDPDDEAFRTMEILYPKTERCISENLNLKTTALWEYQISKLLFFHRVEKFTAVHESPKFHCVHTIAPRHW